MFKNSTAAIIVAAFLLLGLNGCYTKLNFAKPELMPAKPTRAYNWDFGNGWYHDEYSNYDISYGYYYSQWWDDCRWNNNNEPSINITLDSDLTKFNRRDDNNITYSTPALMPATGSSGLYLNSPPEPQNGKHSDDTAPINQPQDSKNNSGDNNANNSGSKQKRGR